MRGATDVRYSTFAPRFAHPPSLKATAWLAAKNYSQALTRLVLIGFCPAHDQSAAKEFLVVQLLHGAFRFLDGLHLHKGKTFRALVVPVTYHLCILHVPYAVEQFKEIALGRVEGQVANVKTWRSDFDRLRFALRPRLALLLRSLLILLLLAVTLVLFAMRAMGYFYLVFALILGGILVYMSVRLLRDQSKKWARTLFWYSNCYLAMIFAVMVVDRVIH